MKFHLLGLLSFLSDIILLMLLLWRKKGFKNHILITLTIYASLSILADIAIILTDSNAKQFVVFGVIFMEVCFIGLLYYFITETKILKYTILTLAILTLIYFTIFASIYAITTFPKMIAAIGILNLIIVSLIAIWDIMFKPHNDKFVKKNAIYIIIGYLIYASGNLFLCISTDKLDNIFSNPGTWSIFLVLNCVKNIFFSIFVLAPFKKTILA